MLLHPHCVLKQSPTIQVSVPNTTFSPSSTHSYTQDIQTTSTSKSTNPMFALYAHPPPTKARPNLKPSILQIQPPNTILTSPTNQLDPHKSNSNQQNITNSYQKQPKKKLKHPKCPQVTASVRLTLSLHYHHPSLPKIPPKKPPKKTN